MPYLNLTTILPPDFRISFTAALLGLMCLMVCALSMDRIRKAGREPARTWYAALIASGLLTWLGLTLCGFFLL